MAHELVPYSFQSPALPDSQMDTWRNKPVSGNCGVMLFFDPQYLEFLTEKIEAWFEGVDEVIWIDSGAIEKHNLNFILLEWENCEIPELFLNILRDEEIIICFSTYFRAEMEEDQ